MTDFDLIKIKINQELPVWFSQNSRPLPWRLTKDPYKIWLSEIILQQTRVDQGWPYYNSFISNFPTVYDLANATIDSVLRLWQGLGYYSRARNLHACSKIIASNFGGNFPPDRRKLVELPGIGEYTSAAIASFAFGKKEAVVDGNVIRVISRVFGIDSDIRKSSALNQIKSIASNLLPDLYHSDFNQAIMEFGALQCSPGNPDCGRCPLSDVCMAYKQNMVSVIPFKGKGNSIRVRYFNYLVIEFHKRILFLRRMNNDIWRYLYEFKLIETTEFRNFDQLELPECLTKRTDYWFLAEESGTYIHILSHQKIMARFYHIHLKELPYDADFLWKNEDFLTMEQIESLPKPILIVRYMVDKIIAAE